MPDLQNVRALLVDDEPAWLNGLSLALERSGAIGEIETCSDSREVLERLGQKPADLVLLDITMPHLSGEELLPQIVERFPATLVIVLTGINQVELSVRCMKAGAFDFFVKTVEQQQLLASIQRGIRMLRLQQENEQLNRQFLSQELSHPEAFREIVSSDPQILMICKYLEAVAPGPNPILILGESGTGKELFARAAHQLGRPDAPWVTLNVAGLDDAIFSDTLFGHLRGAFTGAEQERRGMLEAAAAGTLFLDEIGDLSASSQVKLLRLIQEGEYLPLGADRPRLSQARLVLATNRDLAADVETGRFRQDLYYRLNGHRIQLPPLRQRKNDLPLLFRELLGKAAKKLDKPTPDYPAEILTLLGAYHFPGNIRELEGMITDALSTHSKGTLSMRSFRDAIGTSLSPIGQSASEKKLSFGDLLPSLEEAGELLVREAMKRCQGNQSQAAQLLGISRPALSKRLKKYQARG